MPANAITKGIMSRTTLKAIRVEKIPRSALRYRFLLFAPDITGAFVFKDVGHPRTREENVFLTYHIDTV